MLDAMPCNETNNPFHFSSLEIQSIVAMLQSKLNTFYFMVDNAIFLFRLFYCIVLVPILLCGDFVDLVRTPNIITDEYPPTLF